MSAPPSKAWSVNTSYTGIAGIHSEVHYGASTRNALVDRRASDTMSTEKSIHRKQLKSLENSMLAYSQKMRNIAEGKAKLKLLDSKELSPTPANKTKANEKKVKKSAQSEAGLDTKQRALSPITNVDINGVSPIHMADIGPFRQRSQGSFGNADSYGRMSTDSGFSSDMRSECSDGFSDTCWSDSESSKIHYSSPSTECRIKECWRFSAESVKSDDGSVDKRRSKRRQDRRRRLGADVRPELPTVADIENQENQDNSASQSTPSLDESVSIVPFPGNKLDADAFVPPLQLNNSPDHTSQRILNPTSRGYWSYRAANTPKQIAAVIKPKALQSPTVASMRRHRPRAKPKPSKPFHHIFKYSDAVDNVIRTLDPTDTVAKNNDKLFHGKSDQVAPVLPYLDIDELRQVQLLKSIHESPEPELESESRMIRERSLSAPPAHFKPFVSSLDGVDEHDDSTLKSALKKGNSYSQEKKSVHFFLPDIFNPPKTSR